MSCLLVACSSPDLSSQQCERAAIAQADAEQRWTDLFTLHAADDVAVAETPDDPALNTAHDKSAGELLGARVDMILAEAETRHYCG